MAIYAISSTLGKLTILFEEVINIHLVIYYS